ncbi:hypothetical protein CO165_00110 [Candidatus Roizmanbacteria bacterium CG_4_9_14_3_um_filter_33_18]|uniref:Uncharacterized protein n=2 Tax=Candidatus Roizmaniibacteriota TaxID=1752723 RepID=A0A2M7XZF4_9BACT|nr:MAG: hypothetical protein COW97_02665 [Candidatus Roizmanbacteria bacterium CG22_combo_CG10-13_8_21_14_all_34_12]PJA56086.1 MAG: hypothetical protein CO165_00110 [Candidatus Roizmanbacteria bacterium CG_4_9_14_3_um_filter_33_18]
MAQHISIINSKLNNLKAFQKVNNSFQQKANVGLWCISGSLKFEELRSVEYKINEHDRVFITYRTINNIKEMFELHYDTKTNTILDIFLVS